MERLDCQICSGVPDHSITIGSQDTGTKPAGARISSSPLRVRVAREPNLGWPADHEPHEAAVLGIRQKRRSWKGLHPDLSLIIERRFGLDLAHKSTTMCACWDWRWRSSSGSLW